MSSIAKRKSEHIAIAASGVADFRHLSTLLEDIHFFHNALPEVSLADVSLKTEFLGRELSAPLMITGMTGGTDEAGRINRMLAQAAMTTGVVLGVGSQRPMLLDPTTVSTYRVKNFAKDVLLVGNIGCVQAKEIGWKRVAELAADIDADAMALHLNVGQEMIQQDGDRDFRGLLQTIEDCATRLPIPLIVKETGCGISPEVAMRLAEIDLAAVDVSGAGGTSWVAVEAERAEKDSDAKLLGEELRDWGIPTAVSIVACREAGLTTIASGGLRSGLDAAKALALGADLVGFAAPILRAAFASGADGAISMIEHLVRSIRTVCVLTGCTCIEELLDTPYHIGPNLQSWLDSADL